VNLYKLSRIDLFELPDQPDGEMIELVVIAKDEDSARTMAAQAYPKATNPGDWMEARLTSCVRYKLKDGPAYILTVGQRTKGERGCH